MDDFITMGYEIHNGHFTDERHYHCSILIVYTKANGEKNYQLAEDFSGDQALYIRTIYISPDAWELELSQPIRNYHNHVESWVRLAGQAYKTMPTLEEKQKLINKYLNYRGKILVNYHK